ncbi:hypothetical protein B5M09_000977 [Aphanomyces astaci]|uniref:Vacuolar membrane protease n=1 Tax=Aphanomyces astaci TaxID=112090 RepID=A0A425D809_APHAT|nr:hypothetical protein B5M09_000977 [Aphanomyces astaci]
MGRGLQWLLYLVVACGVCITTHFWRSRMPPVSPPSTSASVFSGQAAFDQLRNITKTKHPVQAQANLDMYHYLYDQLEALNRTVSLNAADDSAWLPNQLVFDTPRSLVRTLPPATATTQPGGATRQGCKDYEGYINETQIVVRVPGTLPSSVLLTAHFDSAPSSYGASDDGAGVAVILETLRALLASPTPLDHTLVVFLDNGEETGLCGSKWFVQSDLVSAFKVKVFVNLEGGGVGGRAILFRATDNQLASLYGQVAPYPHMNSLGGSLISLLGSSTDYQVYKPADIPGVDIAFYEHREYYHTPGDNIDRISAQDVQHCGANVLAITRALLNTNSLDDWSSHDEALYFDVMGQWGVTLTVAKRWLVVLSTWAAAGVVVLVHYYSTYWFDQKTTSMTLGQFVRSVVVSHWSYFATALGVGTFAALLANVPLVGFLLVTRNSLLSWTVLPNAIVGLLVGVDFAAKLWRRQGKTAQSILPLADDWMRLATSGATFGAFVSTLLVFNAPLLYLFPVATVAYAIVLVLVYIGVGFAKSRPSPHPDAMTWQPAVSYASIPPSEEPANLSVVPLAIGMALVTALGVFLFVALPVSVDNLWMIQSVGGCDPLIMAAAPVILAPVLYLVLPWFVLTWGGGEALLLFQVYLAVWAVATVQYAASV